MDTSTEYELMPGDFIECVAAEPYSLDYPPRFVWWRSIQVENSNGPKIIHYPNTDTNTNRLVELN